MKDTDILIEVAKLDGFINIRPTGILDGKLCGYKNPAVLGHPQELPNFLHHSIDNNRSALWMVFHRRTDAKTDMDFWSNFLPTTSPGWNC